MSKKNLVVCFRAAPVEERLIARINEAWGSSLNIVNVGQSDVASALLEADYFMRKFLSIGKKSSRSDV